MATNRKTSRKMISLIAQARASDAAFVPAFSLIAGAEKDLRFTAFVSIAGTDYALAGDGGAVKKFGAVDDALKMIAKVAESGDGTYTVRVETGALLASKVPANMVTWAGSQTVKLGKVKTAQQAVIADIDTQLAAMNGWENGNQAQRAKKDEMQAQRAAVVEDVAAIDAEVARLATIH